MHHVIVKFFEGEDKRGEVFSFNMNFPVFYLQIKDEQGKIENRPIKVDSVKEIIFLKKRDNDGSFMHKETIDQSIYAGVLPYRLMVQFKDGHRVDGSTNKYNPKEKGFFIVPLNPADESERIYINAKAVKSVDCKRLLGKKLVDQSKLDVEEIEETFRKQREEREQRERKTEERKENVVSPTEGFFIIEEQEKKLEEKSEEEVKFKPLGEIIVGAGYITSKQLEEAVGRQKKRKGKRLGQILVDLKYITPTDICVALAGQYHLPWVDLSTVNIPQDVATILPEGTVRELGVIPVGKKEDILVVATSEPQDFSMGMKLSQYTPLAIELVIAYEGHIEAAIEKFFPVK